MLSTNAANGTTTMTVCCTAMAATEKNNPDLLLLVGNTTTNGIFGDGLCTNCNADACPSNRGLVLMSWYMRYNLSILYLCFRCFQYAPAWLAGWTIAGWLLAGDCWCFCWCFPLCFSLCFSIPITGAM